MAAVTADTLTLPRLARPGPDSRPRPVATVLEAPVALEGEGFQVRRAFAGLDLSLVDPFLLLDHLGAVEYGPGEAKGAPDHPHRGMETVTYMIDGALEHRDSTGGGGLVTDGATQWMTAGAGIVHSEMPPEALVRAGGLFHGSQLWVNLPATEKWAPPRYQGIAGGEVALLASEDGGALVRIIAGSLGGVPGPGSTRTPITYAHLTLSPGARVALPWDPDFNGLAYALAGRGAAGAAAAPLVEGHLAVFGPGPADAPGHLVLAAEEHQPAAAPAGLDVLVMGGRPLGEPIAWYGPFVMNTRTEILQAVEDYQAGRMGRIPPATAAPSPV